MTVAAGLLRTRDRKEGGELGTWHIRTGAVAIAILKQPAEQLAALQRIRAGSANAIPGAVSFVVMRARLKPRSWSM